MRFARGAGSAHCRRGARRRSAELPELRNAWYGKSYTFYDTLMALAELAEKGDAEKALQSLKALKAGDSGLEPPPPRLTGRPKAWSSPPREK